jgi:hypothetical protein
MNLTSDAPAERLTRQELAILAHLTEDRSNGEIAALETLALNSVKVVSSRPTPGWGSTSAAKQLNGRGCWGCCNLLQPLPRFGPRT